MNYNKIVGANIRYERQLKNLTTEELAEILDMDCVLLDNLESGQKGTSVKNICKIAEFFSISVDTMLNRDIDGLIEKNAPTPFDIKKETVKDLIDTLTEDEIDFISATVFRLKKLRRYV